MGNPTFALALPHPPAAAGGGPAPRTRLLAAEHQRAAPEPWRRLLTNAASSSSVGACVYDTSQVYSYVCVQTCARLFSELLKTLADILTRRAYILQRVTQCAFHSPLMGHLQ